MADSDWQDPFEDDEAARERAARRAERAARRRAREQEARESLGGRVREELDGERPPAGPPQPERPPAESRQPPLEEREPPASRPAPEERPTPSARPPQRAAPATRIRQRTMGLIGLGALIALVAGAGVLISRSDDGDGATDAGASGRKTVEVTIPEGLDRNQIAQVAKEAGLRGSYLKATRRSGRINLKRYGAAGADNLEGFLFPATYEVFRRGNVRQLVNRQLDAFKENIAGIDTRYARRNGLSVYEIVNVASMIEREIAVPEERELAASVIYNRLAAGNPLGIDATIRYEDQNYDERLLDSRLNEDTPYNTRINPGLPPTPIGNPGLASLEAAANPAETDFFYYVVKPGTCNEHTFVETEEEFRQAEAEYQAALQEEGGSPTEC